ncbi:hypothetical protein BB558_004565 [Smittium angustum]|uniref:DEK-C domain-containing protein n=1 Tax=Smittium angustum TaxID=133377 RepID=A0A2U1J315_SMIAN|nr:hypothetical protein BB558_004565 [Smittium angustum]
MTQELDFDKVRTMCSEIIQGCDLNEITIKMIMKEIEKKLNLEPGTFKNPENKKQLKEIVDDILETLADQDNENEPTEDISNRIVEEPQRELLKPNKELIAKTKKKRTKTKPKTEIIHNDMGDDSDFDTRPQKSVKTEKKNMKKDLIESKEEEEPTKFEEKKIKRKEDSGSDNVSDNSDFDDTPQKPIKGSKKKVTEKSNTSKTPAKNNVESKDQKIIATLKSYVNRCGVRKPWTKVFAGKTPKHQISYLKDTLKSLGMEGRPSLAKCDQIKAKRELEQEMEDIDPKNIIDEEADKKILKPRKRIEKKKQELESEVENADQEELEDQEDSESSDEYSKSENDESTESVEEKRPEKIKRSRVALSGSE